MKKYVKPIAFFESFRLSQQIAACAWDITNLWDKENCYAKYNGDYGEAGGFLDSSVTIFTVNDACLSDGDGLYCEVNGNDSIMVFNS